MGFPSTGIECQTVGDKANSKREEAQMNIKRIGIDIAKNVFQLHGVDADEKTVLIKKLSRIQFIPYILLNISPCTISHEQTRNERKPKPKLKRKDNEKS